MYLRVSITNRCNLRCTYCIPSNPRFAPNVANADELDRLMGAIASVIPLDKIRLTGGEPTLNPHLPRHINTARWLVPTVGLTSNGVLLAPMLEELREAGLSKLNISLDAADAQGFLTRTRRDRFDTVVESIRHARNLGFQPLKINAVATIATDVVSMVRFALAEGAHIRFIELMAIGEARASWQHQFVNAQSLRDQLTASGMRLLQRSDLDQPTSRVYGIDGHDPEHCSVGFITTVSQPFCGSCDRLRLTAEGRLHTCLFDERGTDLLTPLRSDDMEEVLQRICRAVAMKAPPEHFRRQGNMAAMGG